MIHYLLLVGVERQDGINAADILRMTIEPDCILAHFRRSGKPDGRRGLLPSPWAVPTVVERPRNPVVIAAATEASRGER
jgi:hypothetical protein